jgi:hypothetical protein
MRDHRPIFGDRKVAEGAIGATAACQCPAVGDDSELEAMFLQKLLGSREFWIVRRGRVVIHCDTRAVRDQRPVMRPPRRGQ